MLILSFITEYLKMLNVTSLYYVICSLINLSLIILLFTKSFITFTHFKIEIIYKKNIDI